ncbi:MAG: phosphoesterase RecJ protein [Candidatus Peribacteria bacterium]|nr:phosphoesterase RecJ protein [Candidatus Peribacteria bacterium]
MYITLTLHPFTRDIFMSTNRQDVADVQSMLAQAKRVRVVCHRNPDGDAIGSMLGFGLLAERALSNTPVDFYCVDPVPEMFHFLGAAFRVLPPPPIEQWSPETDVVVFVDCAEPKLTELHITHSQLFDGTFKTVMFDHHPSNPLFATKNFLEPTAASACEIIVQFADAAGWDMDAAIATCLLTGVYTDTGGLLHSNTTAQVYRTVARLLRAGARRQAIVTAVFRTASISTLRLWGRVLEKISITEEGAAISAVTEGDFRATGAEYSDLTGAIDYVNAIPGMRFSLVLSERDGKVKGSLRTLRDDVDVAEMAGRFQGGGHKKAAGFALQGKLKPEMRWKVVEDKE